MRFGVRLSPAGATRADFILPVGSIEETITVYGTAPLSATTTRPPARASTAASSSVFR